MIDMVPNLKKMGFVNHDLRKFPKLTMERYLTYVREKKDGPIHIVPMEWERGLDKYGILLLMYMPHFGCTTKVNAYVKQLLLYFHGGCMWININISVDVAR